MTAIAEAAPSGDTEPARDEDGRADDHHVQDELVRLAEELDEQVLGARRLELDDEVADGDDERRRAGDEPGDELPDRDAERRRERTRDERGGVEACARGVGHASAPRGRACSWRPLERERR